MKKSYLLPGISILGGSVGVVLRRWQLGTAFEPSTGLPISGSPATIALIVLSVAVAALLLLVARNKRSLPLQYQAAFHCGEFPYFVVVCAGGVLTGVGGVLALLDFVRMDRSLLVLAFGIFAILSAICILLIGARNFKSGWRGQGSLLLLAPAFSHCLWLMVSYQGWARDPVISDYVFALFAIMASMLAYYYMAAYSFDTARETLTLFTGFLAIFFCMIALADPMDLATRCLYLAAICYILPNVIVLCRNSEQIGGFSNPNAPAADPDMPLKEEPSHE